MISIISACLHQREMPQITDKYRCLSGKLSCRYRCCISGIYICEFHFMSWRTLKYNHNIIPLITVPYGKTQKITFICWEGNSFFRIHKYTKSTFHLKIKICIFVMTQHYSNIFNKLVYRNKQTHTLGQNVVWDSYLFRQMNKIYTNLETTDTNMIQKYFIG